MTSLSRSSLVVRATASDIVVIYKCIGGRNARHFLFSLMDVLRFCRNWTLPIAMGMGVLIYFVYVNIPWLAPAKPYVLRAVDIVQPMLIFCMLLLSFCKISFQDLHPCKWHVWLLLIQGGCFLLLGLLLVCFPGFSGRVLVEGAMLCLICPTATASAVITFKLGGSAARVTTYTILVNFLAALLIPLVVPLLSPNAGESFGVSFTRIMGKVFPMLLCPFVLAVLLRFLCPKLHARLAGMQNVSFYMWAVALMLAIALTVKSIVHSEVAVWYQIGLAVVSFLCCIAQFYFGKRIGNCYGDSISAGQALGQKNTVFAIWLGYTFFTPVTSIAAGFYSVWHNIVNSYQLYRLRKRTER